LSKPVILKTCPMLKLPTELSADAHAGAWLLDLIDLGGGQMWGWYLRWPRWSNAFSVYKLLECHALLVLRTQALASSGPLLNTDSWVSLSRSEMGQGACICHKFLHAAAASGPLHTQLLPIGI
jgi:hypothetical protein